jgi:hypothetical protein
MNAIVYELNLIREAVQAMAILMGTALVAYAFVEALKANRR